MAMLSRTHLLGGFVAGALGALIFHQGLVWLLGQAGVISFPAYSLEPTRPFGVPAVLSLAFLGQPNKVGHKEFSVFNRIRTARHTDGLINSATFAPMRAALPETTTISTDSLIRYLEHRWQRGEISDFAFTRKRRELIDAGDRRTTRG